LFKATKILCSKKEYEIGLTFATAEWIVSI